MRLNSAPHLVPTVEFSLDLISKLRDRQTRDRTALFLAEGARFLYKAQQCGRDPAALVICKLLAANAYGFGFLRTVEKLRTPTIYVSPGEFAEVSASSEPNVVLIVFRQSAQRLPPEIGRRDMWIGIEHLRTQGNVGSLMRSAAAAGAKGLMIFGPPRDRMDPFDPLTERASMS